MIQMYEALKQNLEREQWKGTLHEIGVKQLLNKGMVKI